MNLDEAILTELKKLSAFADMQRKITKWTFIFIGVFIPALIVFGIVMESRLNTSSEDNGPLVKKESPTWTDVDWRIRRGEPDEAIRIGEDLIQRAPQYPDGHRLLASAYLAAGKVEQAREHYLHAFELFPSEEHQRLLVAINRRIEGGPQPSGSANQSQPVRLQTNQPSAAAGSGR
jgi:tetratricopeptide (TPR) repeat protein